MAEFFGSIWWMIVVLGLLVTFHEFGHFWVARRCGVKVLRFSVGFGKPLWLRKGRDGTEYVVAGIPLGGYVRMLDEREGPVPAEQLPQAFNRKPLHQRFAIVAAGPIFNLVFAVIAFWLMFLTGIPELRPLLGQAEGMSAAAGLQTTDEIIAVDEVETASWTHVRLALIPRALDRKDTTLLVRDQFGLERRIQLPLSTLGEDFREELVLSELGMSEWRPVIPAVIDTVVADSPADLAGLRPGDRIAAIGGEPVPDWAYLGPLLARHGKAGEPMPVTILRDGNELAVDISPAKEKQGLFSSRLIMGITAQPLSAEDEALANRTYVITQYGPLESVPKAFTETWRLTSTTFGLLWRMITGSASVRNLSGPITIARVANDAAAAGFSQFLFFLGLISLSLGILNLLPIPVLDGGHLLYFLIEWVKGSPVSEQTQIAGQYVGMLALAGLMSLAIVNDILRLFG